MIRRHVPLALVRPSFTKRGKEYTDFGVQFRSVRPDQSSLTVVVHYLKNGDCVYGFTHRKQQRLVPVVHLFRALGGWTDLEIAEAIVRGETGDTFLVERTRALLASARGQEHFSQDAALAYIGSVFKVSLAMAPDASDYEAGLRFAEELLLPHLPASDGEGKARLLAALVRKLYALVAGRCAPDSADSTMNHELLLPGQLFCMVLREQLQEMLVRVREAVAVDVRMGKPGIGFEDSQYLANTIKRALPPVGQKMEYLLATGNLITRTGIDLMQTSGFTIVADKLNWFRYVSHFRCVHRGAFFTTMKTTAVRKLLPDGWGFLCPVHTPDGSPCGLLMHITASCRAVVVEEDPTQLPAVLQQLGVAAPYLSPGTEALDVMLDGAIVGHVPESRAADLVAQLRVLKCDPTDQRVPASTEIALVLPSRGGQYPGVFLFTGLARMVRPVRSLVTGGEELVGPFEQAYMDIAVRADEAVAGVTTHMELNTTNFLSVIANMTPFSDNNQSPRNMYQCQMAKQTMGTPCTSLKYRADNKIYHLRTPQSPMVRPAAYDAYGFNTFPLGTNAIVAVIAYTGYDMEDAMILSKASVERGFMHAHVVMTKVVNLATDLASCDPALEYEFGCKPTERAVAEGKLGVDGLPHIGALLEKGDPLYAWQTKDGSSASIERYKGETARVLQVTRVAPNKERKERGAAKSGQMATIKLSVRRNPIIGDKVASRAGQKGTCAQLWPASDMPFTEDGMSPDILFNPHGFPSRMTIGMIIESMAGKSSAMHGIGQDATPFNFSEDDPPSQYFGEQLKSAGYNYHGTERMYSGITGEEFDCDIFIGVVYYQRLRHMVSDKFQVRTTGPVHAATRQPIKGRKRAGGVRFGEMERDALLSHGSAFLLQDRLFHNSDASEVHVCTECGVVVSPVLAPAATGGGLRCALGCTAGKVVTVAVPYVFRYLVAELMCMNVKVRVGVAAVAEHS